MLPYSNRLGFCRFEWEGRNYSTVQNFEGSPHSLHGVGWQRPWTVLEQQSDLVALGYQHRPDEHWPFAFEVRQVFTLMQNHFAVTLSVRNTDTQSQPAGLGWHPYFPLREQSRLQIDIASRWLPDSDQLPQTGQAVDRLDGPVSELNLDHCFEDWHGSACLEDEYLRIAIRSSLDRLVVFTPNERGYYCIEPVSHVTNAIRCADPIAQGLCDLQPEHTLCAEMHLEVERK
jgi:aldose 1-epimerase